MGFDVSDNHMLVIISKIAYTGKVLGITTIKKNADVFLLNFYAKIYSFSLLKELKPHLNEYDLKHLEDGEPIIVYNLAYYEPTYGP